MANNEQKMSDPINSQHSMHMREAETSAQSGGSFRYVSGQFPALTDGSSSKEKVFETLKEMFLGAIDEDTLLDVLEEKLYDFNESFDALGELTSSTSTHEAARKSTSPESESELQHPSLLEYIPESAWIEAPGNTPHMKNASDSNSGPRKAASAPVQICHQPLHPTAAMTVAKSTKVVVPSESQRVIESILKAVQMKQKTLVIMRGLPGSGKSFLANELLHLSNVSSKVCSADSFFMRGGQYVFSRENISKAHQRCQKMALQAATKNCMLIIIDNTNTQIWEMGPYVALAMEHGYRLALLEPNTYWSYDPEQLVKCNIHGVPLENIEKMLLRFEKITVDQLILKMGYNVSDTKYITANYAVEEPAKKTRKKPRTRKRTSKSDNGSVILSSPSSPAPEQQDENQCVQSSLEEANAPQDAVNSPQYVGFNEFCASMMLTPHKTACPPPNSFVADSMSKHGEEWYNLDQVPTKLTAADNLISFDESERRGEAAQSEAQSSNLLIEDAGQEDTSKATFDMGEAAEQGETEPSVNVKLQSLFPQLHDTYLDSILTECHGNIDWAIDMLLESPMVLQDAVDQQSAATAVEITTRYKSPEKTIQTASVEQGRVKLEKRHMSKEAMELKRKLEQLVVLNQATPRRSNKRRSDEAASSSKIVQTLEWPAAETHGSDEEDEDEQFVEMPLEKGFAETLLHMFGGPPLTKMKDFKPSDLLVNIPVSVAHCLHFFWLETLQQNFDKREEEFRQLLNNDENLAFELTQQNDRSHPKEVPDLKEIMDMEMTLACFRNEQKVSKTDIATNLSRQLLADQFPKIDSQALDSVFAAHGHNYKKTLDAIIASFGGNSSVCTVMSPEAIARCEKQLLEKARDETLKLASEKKKTQLVVEVPLSQLSSNDERKQALEEAQRYRDEANEHRKHRVQCFNKAENALRQGMPQVARYYSEMGQLHKQRMEQANGSAAACLFGVANADTLDLHYLYVAEALEVLDVFLDYHAERVSKGCQKRKTVELVTGRGLRSEGGKPRIKPAVIRRLKQRGLRFEEINPGSLCVFLSPHMTSSCK